MSFETFTVTISPPGRVGVKLAQRRHDNGVVVVGSKNPGVQQYDVLVSLNGTTLRNVEGGLDGITKLFKKHENSDMTIVLHRASREGDFSNKSCFVDQEKKSRCNCKLSTYSSVMPLCRKHIFGHCTFTDDNGKKCKSNARDRTGRCNRHGWGECNFTDDNGIGCTNIACRKGGPCEAHKFGKCTFTENDGTECQNNATSKSRLCKSHDFGECAFTECENKARWSGGLCCKHDPNARRCRMTNRGGLRCINSNFWGGSGGYCNICRTIGDAERQEEATGGECHPLTVLLERMNKIKDDRTLTSHMSELQLKTMTLLHNIRTLMTHDRFQSESFSVNESLSKLVDEMMKEILTDKKYKDAWVRCSDDSHIQLPVYVRDTVLTVVKGALKGYGGDGFDYRGVLSEKNVHDIIDEIIRVVKDKGLHVGNKDKGLLIVKVGSEGTMESEELASTRPGDKITYPGEAFVRAKYTALPLQLTPNQRGCAESIATSFLLGLGIGGNINVPGYSVPSGTDSSASGLYLMFSTARSLSRHHAARATAPAKRPSAPPGHKIVPIETVADAPTAAAAGGGVDDDAVSTTDANTSATAGENTTAQFCGECAVQPSEVATAMPTDESSPETAHGSDDLKPAAQPISGVPGMVVADPMRCCPWLFGGLLVNPLCLVPFLYISFLHNYSR